MTDAVDAASMVAAGVLDVQRAVDGAVVLVADATPLIRELLADVGARLGSPDGEATSWLLQDYAAARLRADTEPDSPRAESLADSLLTQAMHDAGYARPPKVGIRMYGTTPLIVSEHLIRATTPEIRDLRHRILAAQRAMENA